MTAASNFKRDPSGVNDVAIRRATRSWFRALGVVLWLCLALQPRWASASDSALELRVQTQGGLIQLGRLGHVVDQSQRPLSLTRLDLLLSGLSLQRADGSWVHHPKWYGFFRADQAARRQVLPPVPGGDYVALRFAVGVDPKANHADPNRLGPDHPLHPLVNGMHWNWTGGYVFMALEGHWQFDRAPVGSTGGFSYHLAGNSNRVVVTVPARFRLRSGSLLRLELDVQRLLVGIDLVGMGDSTHSRTQDPVVIALKRALPQAFRLADVTDGPPQLQAARATAAHAGTVPRSRLYPLALSAQLPTVELPADNLPTVDGVALGRQLFHDRRLSRDGTLSCASCHRPERAFSDGDRSFSTGIGAQLGKRNTPPLFNLAWVPELGWDGRERQLRKQALAPVLQAHEMAESWPRVLEKLNADLQLRQRFERAFSKGLTEESIGLALEQFLLTLVSQDAKFDRVMKGAAQFSAAEKRGLDLFLTEHDPAKGLFGADCFHCHGGNLFTHQRFANIGLPAKGNDTGREGVTGDPADRGKFRTPSLRNVALTAPYMHDGRFATLEEVVEHYNSGVQRTANLDPNLAKHPVQGMRLSREDKAALVAFLRTLTDPAMGSASLLPAEGNSRSRAAQP